jgi:hypothetical protein
VRIKLFSSRRYFFLISSALLKPLTISNVLFFLTSLYLLDFYSYYTSCSLNLMPLGLGAGVAVRDSSKL